MLMILAQDKNLICVWAVWQPCLRARLLPPSFPTCTCSVAAAGRGGGVSWNRTFKRRARWNHRLHVSRIDELSLDAATLRRCDAASFLDASSSGVTSRRVCLLLVMGVRTSNLFLFETSNVWKLFIWLFFGALRRLLSFPPLPFHKHKRGIGWVQLSKTKKHRQNSTKLKKMFDFASVFEGALKVSSTIQTDI